jgi:hypothetical protein
LVTAGKGIVSRDSSSFTFSHWANKLRFLIERHSKLKNEIKNERNNNDRLFLEVVLCLVLHVSVVVEYVGVHPGQRLTLHVQAQAQPHNNR